MFRVVLGINPKGEGGSVTGGWGVGGRMAELGKLVGPANCGPDSAVISTMAICYLIPNVFCEP